MKKKIIRFYLILITGLVLTAGVHAQQKYTPPALSNPDSWSMILLPDPQTYVKFERNQPIFNLMTSWIGENIDPLHIKMVLCTGDLVEHNTTIDLDPGKANQSPEAQWKAVAAGLGKLDGKVPYVAVAGNHDYGIIKPADDRKSHYGTYFPVDKNPLNKAILREIGLNAEGVPTLENAAYELISPQGRKFLVLALEFAPRNAVIDWANKVVNQPKYKDHTVILITHSYMQADNERIKKENYKIADANYGEDIWQKLVKPSKNIEMVIAGHIGKPNNMRAHVAFRTDTNAGGKKVQQMVFNAQALGGGWYGNGGDGWLRILEFLPDGKTVKVKTFSPLFAISPTTQQFAWRTASFDEFTFTLD
ncbi:serine/threonine protein phosphatase [Pedobacter sp. BS3]|uniref:metallophosphoesterase n=1 Tax=Pedobacter sp. BS3 TaxID=2567937 RepID=UPI0011EC381B|nr:metallophosphoesterase [Pedobacter sp. BS3]TZF82537.1 serine/threonine protein phosphatase [Pedobacter sp. BS3]